MSGRHGACTAVGMRFYIQHSRAELTRQATGALQREQTAHERNAYLMVMISWGELPRGCCGASFLQQRAMQSCLSCHDRISLRPLRGDAELGQELGDIVNCFVVLKEIGSLHSTWL
jgi:hypothetical protein